MSAVSPDRPGRTTGVAIVTGGGSGIGAAIARALAAADWTVAIAGRRASLLHEVASERADGRIVPVAADVTHAADVDRLVAEVVARFGRIDLLVNNAGRGGSTVPLDETDIAEWREIVDLNVTGTFLCTRAVFRVMREQHPRGGRIINNGSLSAWVPRPHSIAYAATKHAITGITRATALDGRALGIACGQLDVGNAASAMTSGMSGGVLQADGSTRPEPTIDPRDVADAVVYMAGLPLDANVAELQVMATGMPFVGRG